MIGLDDTRAGMLRVERLNVTLSAGAVAASFAFFTPLIATSIAAGALLEVVNFRALHASARSFFAGQLGGANLWVGFVALRLAVFGAAMALAVALGAHAIAFIVGLSIVLPAVVIDSWRNRPPVLDQSDYPVPDADDPSWDEFSLWRIEKAPEPSQREPSQREPSQREPSQREPSQNEPSQNELGKAEEDAR